MWHLLLLPLAFPALAESSAAHDLTITSPKDGELVQIADINATATIALQYMLRGPSVSSVCLSLLRSRLRWYRGPIFSRDLGSMSPYASGCFATSQPVTLEKIPSGSYALQATARGDGGSAALANASVFFAVSPRPPSDDSGGAGGADGGAAGQADFEPTYEWQEVGDKQRVPSGLEVSLRLDGGAHGRLARIPASWRLQLYMEEEGAFLRTDVTRATPLADISAAAAAQAKAVAAKRHRAASPPVEAACFGLFAGGEALPGAATVEAARLFSRRGQLQIKRRPCPGEPGGVLGGGGGGKGEGTPAEEPRVGAQATLALALAAPMAAP